MKIKIGQITLGVELETNKSIIFKELAFVYIVNGKKFLNEKEAIAYSDKIKKEEK